MKLLDYSWNEDSYQAMGKQEDLLHVHVVPDKNLNSEEYLWAASLAGKWLATLSMFLT